MAKSLRSKWKRKMRANKRVVYGEKENARMIKNIEAYKKEMEEAQIEKADYIPLEKMETDSSKEKGLLNEQGNYPVWMSRREIQNKKGKTTKRLKRINRASIRKSKKKQNKLK